MKNYFTLQIKRIAKILPFITILTLVLLIGLATILSGMITKLAASDKNKPFTVAVTGDMENSYLQLGMTAMQTLDETRFSIKFIEMSEAQAQKALETAKISAYIIIPENFIDKAIYGDIDPITFVTSPGMESVTGILKKEITELITEMVICSQQGSYGVEDALNDNGLEAISGTHLNSISIDYAEMVFKRNKLYKATEVGVTDGISTIEYYVCAIFLLLLVLIGIPFAAIYIKKDYALNRLMLSRGFSTIKQISFEYLAHLISMLIQAAVIMLILVAVLLVAPHLMSTSLPLEINADIIFKTIPVIIMLSAFNIMMFEFSSNIVSGLLLHFFTAIGLCYITGCMYPIYTFPRGIRTLSMFLPTGIARSYLASAFSLETSFINLLGLLAYSVIFLLLAWFLRYRKTVKMGG